MRLKILLATLPAVLVAAGALSTPSRADPYEERLHRLHAECDRGDRRACVEFGHVIHEGREYHAEWRRTHPEWWWWERR